MMKLTAEQKKTARHLFEIMPKRTELFINENGEFFTNENYALNSVSQDASKVLKFTRTDVVETTEEKKATKPTATKPKATKPTEETPATEETNPENQ